jgi:aspartate kinase
MVVLKFGGSSVATSAAIARVCDIVSRERRPRAIVVSALGGVTDQLIELARLAGDGCQPDAERLLDALRARHRDVVRSIAAPARRRALEADLDATWRDVQAPLQRSAAAGCCPPAWRDAMVASGELASSRLVTAFLAERGVPAVWVDARRVVVTDGRHGEASPDIDATRGRVRAEVLARVLCREVPVVGGFVGATPDGATTTLGRGGSDYSASLIGASADADEVQIWTDTDGVLTADPRELPQAQTVDRLSYGEAAALASAGAKVLHPATVAPAVATRIPVRVLNSQRPDAAGTLITADHGGRARALAGLTRKAGRRPGLSEVTVVGEALRWHAELTADVLRTAGRACLGAVTRSPGACHLTLTVADRDARNVLASLHAQFFERADVQSARDARVPHQSPELPPAFGQEVWA